MKNRFLMSGILGVIGSMLGIHAASFTDGNFECDITYATGSACATIVGATGVSGTLTIPDTVENDGTTYDVYSIAEKAFQGETAITEVRCGNKLQVVGDYAFAGCSNLQTFTAGTAVRWLGKYAFQNCTSLKSASFHPAAVRFDYAAFDGCTAMERVDYSGSLNQWAAITFTNTGTSNPLSAAHNLYIGGVLVTNLDNMTATSISSYAFYGATCLSGRLNIPATLQTIGSQAFNGCTGITGINYMGTLAEWMQRELGGSLLSYSGGELYIQGQLLTSLTIPDNVTKIANYAFQNLTSLTGPVVIPQSVKTVGYYAFSGSGITSLTVGDGVTSLGSNVCSDCVSLESVTIGNSVNSVQLNSFKGCTSLRSVSFGNSITTIAQYAFQNCSSLAGTLTLPVSLKTIGDYAFDGCSSLTGQLNIHDNITSIGRECFKNCSQISMLSLGNSLTSVGQAAFNGCSSISGSVSIPVSITELPDYCFQDCSSLEAVEIGEQVTAIGRYCFSGCSSLSGKITLPSKIKSLPENIFGDCIALVEVVMPEGLTTIGNNAFTGCRGLKTVEIPSTVSMVGQYAYYRCTGIESIVVKEGVKSLLQGAFYNCESLKTLELPESVTSISQSLCWQCYNLEHISMGSNVTSIGTRAFSECALLGEVVIPDNVETIGEEAFSSNPYVTSLVVGKSVTTVGSYAFSMSGLKMITSKAEVPPTCQASTFTAVNKSIPLYVPVGTTDNYKAAPAWMDFSRVASNPVFVTSIEVQKDGVPVNSVEAIIGDMFELTANVTPADATFTEVEWALSNTAAINLQKTETGTVTLKPIEEGEYTLTVSATDGSDVSTIINLTIVPRPPLYTVTYMLDGSEYSTQQYEAGDEIIAPEVPEKTGYTFSGWNDLPEVMPAEDITVTGTYTVNSYTITYYVDSEVYDTQEFAYGAEIMPLEEPEKEGYTFSGWSDIPAVMPAEDITVTGTYTVNSYTIIYYVDSEVYDTQEFAYGAEIMPLEEPEKEGYTFSGWSDIPVVMPAEDITVTGSFEVNDYIVTYYLDNVLFTTYKVPFGSDVPVPDVTNLPDGKLFDSWITEIPDTMPAHDLDIYGTTKAQSGIEAVLIDPDIVVDIYTVAGVLLKHNANSKDILNLKSGYYIVTTPDARHKVCVK